MNRCFVYPCLVALFVLSAGTAGASLIGDQVLVEYVNVGVLDAASVIVGPGVELTNFAGLFDIDIDAEEVWIFSDSTVGFLSGPFNGFVFSDLDWLDSNGDVVPGEILGVAIDTTIEGWNASRVTFGADFFMLDFQNLTLGSSDEFHVHLDVNHGVVPEPATMTLMGLGLVGFALRRRKMKA